MTKHILLALSFASLGFCTSTFAATHSEKNIQQLEVRVEQLRTAMIEADAVKLKELSAKELSYGHLIPTANIGQLTNIHFLPQSVQG